MLYALEHYEELVRFPAMPCLAMGLEEDDSHH
jgi:hypothetical protein